MRYRTPVITLLFVILLGLVACGRADTIEQPATLEATSVPDEPTPAAVDSTGTCPAAAEGLAQLIVPEHGYCLLYPAEYKIEKPNDSETVLVIDSLLNVTDPRVHVSVEPAQGRTVEMAADDFVIEYLGGEESMADFGTTRSNTTVAGESAVLIDHLPGQDLNRRLLVVHDDLLYQLFFSPLDDEDNARMEAFYEQITGSLAFMPVLAAIANCPEATTGLQLLSDPERGYCLLYPAEYKIEKPKDNETVLVLGGLLNAGDPRAHILVEPALGRTAEVVAEDFLAELLAGADMNDFGIVRGATTLSGVPAVLLDHLPGQDLNRRLIAVHDNLLYQFFFAPVLDEGNERLEAFYNQIVNSLTFVPLGEPLANDCLVPADGEQLISSEQLGYCLVLPSEYQVEQDAYSNGVSGTASFFVGTRIDTSRPRLYLGVEPAAGRSGQQAAEELAAAYSAEPGIEQVGGVTMGFEPAGRLDNVPGDGLTRVVLAAYDDRLYALTFIPAADAAAGGAEFEALYDLVLRSFRFLPRTGSTTTDSGSAYGVSMVLDPGLGETMRAEMMAAFYDEEGMVYVNMPAHIRLTFPGSYAAGDPRLRRQQLNLTEMPQVIVFPAAAYGAMSPAAAGEIALLQQLLEERPAVPGGRLPYLPLVNAAQVLASQPAYLSFQNGAGMRYLTLYAQGVEPVTNQQLFYTFQGLTDGGIYYVAAFFPVTTVSLPDAPVVDDWEAFSAGFSGYIEETRASLDGLQAAAFEPDLTLLDQAVASLLVEPAVDLDSGEVSYQPSLTPDAGPAFIGPITGMVYRTFDQAGSQYILSQVDQQGEAQTRLATPDPMLVAPDATHAAYLDGQGRLWLVDLASGAERELAVGQTLGSSVQWGDSQTLLVGLPPESGEGENGFGHVAMVDIDSNELQLVDEEYLSLGRPAMSPDGQKVAYDVAPGEGEAARSGRLYDRNGTQQAVDPAEFIGLESLKARHLYNPSWSPDGRRMAWLAAGDEGTRLVVLDLALKQGLVVHAWQPVQFGALPPTPVWSVDGQWLALEVWAADPEESGLWIFPANGTFARFHATSGADPVWLNSSQLIYADLDSDRNGVLRLHDMSRGEQGVLELPAGSTVLLTNPQL